MEVCPAGSFCFDKNTFLLGLLSLIILVVFYIGSNNDKFYRIEKSLDENRDKINKKINKYRDRVNSLTQINNNLERNAESNSYLNAERHYQADKDQQRIYNPLMPPERSFPYRISRRGVPINIPTRGHSTGYQQVGALIQDDGTGNNQKILPLYGEQTYPGSRQWKYYTSSDGYNAIKLPIVNNGKDCQDTYGCDEIYEGTVVNVKGHDSGFKANIYKLDSPRYLPHVY